ncbi:beta-glucosidase [Parabacteroides sp. PH5-16]|nr:beta-glucosidase [Parabacteroides sp. PH5-16]MDH6383154.1 beta-glucosidase [Parabacteroides sp. PH5-17]
MMKRNIILFFLLTGIVLISCAQQQSVKPAIPKDEKIEQQVEALLKKMTLEEKIGQMTELAIDAITLRTNPFAGIDMQNFKVEDLKAILAKYGLEDQFKLTDEMPGQETFMGIYMAIQGIESKKGFQIDEVLLDSVISKYKVGSILNVPAGIAQTPQEWERIIKIIQDKSMKEIGIPCIYGVDQIHGTTYTMGGTFFPQGVNMAASFNRALVREGARISAYETKAGSIPWTYAPVVDLGRDPRWPRQWEGYGEDTYLNTVMGREAVLGFQGEDPNHIGPHSVAVSMKHYMGYGVPVSGKDRTPSSISVQDMREKHFAPHLEAIRAGALTVMVNSATNNGLPFHANYELLTEWLKEDLNWDGLIVTDWADINNLYTRDKVASSKKEAIKMAINAGIDMSMVPYEWTFCTLLKELVEEGEVKMSRIDDAVRRVLRLKYRLGLFDTPAYNHADFPLFGSDEHAKVALGAAEEGIVLLKNTNNILPLPQGKKFLLTGPNANSMRTLNGGWSYSWQGDKADECAADHNTILEAFQNKFGANNIIHEAGVTYKQEGSWWEENAPQIEKAVAAARGVDYIIACIGENSYCETPGNLNNLTLSSNQLNLVKALATTGKPIVLILNQGRPRIINEIEPLAKAVVNIMLPGNYGGDALANLLAGDTNFSGKMPFTYPKEINSLVTYDHKPSEHIGRQMEGAYNYDAVVNVQWAFGYGLSYTTFAYSNLKVDKASFTADDELTFTVDVKNTGNLIGKESILLFSSDLVASLTPDVRRLRAFEKVELKPNETKSIALKVKGSDLAFVGYDGKWILEKGDFRFQTGDQIVNVTCTTTKKWETPNK